MDELKQINVTEPTQEAARNQEVPTMEPTSLASVPRRVKSKNLTLVMVIVGVLAGTVTGFFVAQKRLLLAGSGTSLSGKMEQNPTSAGAIKVGDTFGTKDEGTFRDSAEGILMSGGIDGEGSHHIERGDNKSQWVYVTSSVVDLDMFVGHRIQAWGETNQGKKAGWLMDVGKLKVLELNVAPATSDTATQD